MRGLPLLCLLPLALLAACRAQPAQERNVFPAPQRPVAPVVSSRYLNEDARDSLGEFETVVRLAEIGPGMSVADIGAGEGYYTVRLSPMVGRIVGLDEVPTALDDARDANGPARIIVVPGR